MNEINTDQNQKPKRSKQVIVSVAFVSVGIVLIFIVIMLSALTARTQNKQLSACQANLNELSKAIWKYSVYNEQKLPSADTWCDLVSEYLVASPDKVFKCPAAKVGRCNYALNENVAEMILPNVPSDVVLIFESSRGYNSAGGPELLAGEVHKDGVGAEGCNILFSAGWPKFIKKDDLDTLRWKP